MTKIVTIMMITMLKIRTKIYFDDVDEMVGDDDMDEDDDKDNYADNTFNNDGWLRLQSSRY